MPCGDQRSRPAVHTVSCGEATPQYAARGYGRGRARLTYKLIDMTTARPAGGEGLGVGGSRRRQPASHRPTQPLCQPKHRLIQAESTTWLQQNMCCFFSNRFLWLPFHCHQGRFCNGTALRLTLSDKLNRVLAPPDGVNIYRGRARVDGRQTFLVPPHPTHGAALAAARAVSSTDNGIGPGTRGGTTGGRSAVCRTVALPRPRKRHTVVLKRCAPKDSAVTVEVKYITSFLSVLTRGLGESYPSSISILVTHHAQ